MRILLWNAPAAEPASGSAFGPWVCLSFLRRGEDYEGNATLLTEAEADREGAGIGMNHRSACISSDTSQDSHFVPAWRETAVRVQIYRKQNPAA